MVFRVIGVLLEGVAAGTQSWLYPSYYGRLETLFDAFNGPNRSLLSFRLPFFRCTDAKNSIWSDFIGCLQPQS